MIERRGAYVTFDGGEGTGKTTQGKLFRERLGVLFVLEPGQTKLGQEIRQIILHNDTQTTPEAELFLFCADRHATLHTVTLPALARGQSVVSDRSYLSTIAYQHYGSNLPLDYVKDATRLTIGSNLPDKQVLFDAPYEQTFNRLRSSGKNIIDDRFERESQNFHNRVRNGFLALAKELGSRAVLIDASGSVTEVHQQLSNELDELLINGVAV